MGKWGSGAPLGVPTALVLGLMLGLELGLGLVLVLVAVYGGRQADGGARGGASSPSSDAVKGATAAGAGSWGVPGRRQEGAEKCRSSSRVPAGGGCSTKRGIPSDRPALRAPLVPAQGRGLDEGGGCTLPAQGPCESSARAGAEGSRWRVLRAPRGSLLRVRSSAIWTAAVMGPQAPLGGCTSKRGQGPQGAKYWRRAAHPLLRKVQARSCLPRGVPERVEVQGSGNGVLGFKEGQSKAQLEQQEEWGNFWVKAEPSAGMTVHIVGPGA